MKARARSVFTAWLLTACMAMPAVAQNSAQTPSTTPPAANSDPNENSAQTPSASPADAPASSTPDAPTTAPNVKSGSKNDVDAIGNRNVGKRGLGDWYSTET